MIVIAYREVTVSINSDLTQSGGEGRLLAATIQLIRFH